MKLFQKFLSVVFATLIFASQSGMAFNLHYCKGALASVTLGEAKEICEIDVKDVTSEKKCCAKKQASHKECCKDSKIDLKEISSDDVITKNFKVDLSFFYFQEYQFKLKNVVSTPVKQAQKFYTTTYATNAPPLYKLYCQFLLYA
nr:hypothetical protein [uncultured Flavobacterium sp.]